MKQTIDISLDVSKIDKTALYESPKTGKKYLNISVLIRDEKDQYGNDGFVVQDIGKERRMAGEKGPILGNWKQLGQQVPPQQRELKPDPGAFVPQAEDDGDSILF
jgi:hypothetical protein